MKKTICIMMFIVIAVFLIAKEPQVKGYSSVDKSTVEQTKDTSASEGVQKSISSKLIRFHVIANSDSVEDQALKLKVRDSVLDYISPKLKKSKSINESREIIKKEDKAIKEIAYSVIQKNGYNYSVDTTLSIENFPVKSYGNITLPQGKYEAYRILIGNAKGQNWWCVMFPPLCFVDITKGETSKKETEKEMKKILNDKEYKVVSDIESDKKSVDNSSKGNNEIKVRFKLLEVFNALKDKFMNSNNSKEEKVAQKS